VHHPDFDKKLPFDVDVALIFLQRSQRIGVPLMRLNEDSSYPREGTTSVTVGWGDTKSGGSQSDVLLEVDVDVMTNRKCEGEGHYEGMVLDTMICTPEGGGHCQGDSGGPLIVRGDNPEEDIEIGIVSWGTGCGDLPMVYARVSEAYDWIAESVCDESDDPPNSLCGPPPTLEPTDMPTESPTPNPKNVPTLRPTRNPTRRPTRNPTRNPTRRPTRSK